MFSLLVQPLRHFIDSGPDGFKKNFEEEMLCDREIFSILHFDKYNNAIAKETIAIGNENNCRLKIILVFKRAIEYKTYSIISVHNHPNGVLRPSEDDLDVWSKIDQTGSVLGITVKDHMIVSPRGWFSVEKLLVNGRRLSKGLWKNVK